MSWVTTRTALVAVGGLLRPPRQLRQRPGAQRCEATGGSSEKAANSRRATRQVRPPRELPPRRGNHTPSRCDKSNWLRFGGGSVARTQPMANFTPRKTFQLGRGTGGRRCGTAQGARPRPASGSDALCAPHFPFAPQARPVRTREGDGRARPPAPPRARNGLPANGAEEGRDSGARLACRRNSAVCHRVRRGVRARSVHVGPMAPTPTTTS